MEKQITVLTATYNRAHLLPDLYQSLCRQTCKDFEWVIVDDGSTDNTKEVVQSFDCPFPKRYIYQKNGGKNRAVNYGVTLITTPFTMIVDSDDYLTDDAIEFLTHHANKVLHIQNLAGIAGLKGVNTLNALKQVAFEANTYITADNLHRHLYNLERDACEVYKTSILKAHPFHIWKGEKFSPEEIVWNQIALEGYALRWYNKVTCIVRYQEEGLTQGSFKLLRDNPMGYASMYKQKISLVNSFKWRYYNACQMIAYSILGKHHSYIFKESNYFFLILSAIPCGIALAIRRKIQFNH